MDLEPLTVRNARGGCIARPALCLFLYSDKPVHELTSSAADVVAAYLEQVGVDRMSTYVGNNGELRKFTPRKLSQDLRQLRDFPPSLGAAWIEYNSDPDGWAGDHGVLLYATDFQKYEHERQRDNLLRLDFPAEYWKHALDAFIDFVNRVAEMFPFESGNAGYAFKRTSGTKGSAIKPVNRLLPRYMGFDPCYQDVQDKMRGHTFSAHWLNLLNDRLSDALGGFQQISQRLAAADVRRISDGVLIRGCKRPAIGDSNRRAPDIGLLPDVARLLKPTRAPVTRMGEPSFDAARWLARFDDMESRPWDNSP